MAVALRIPSVQLTVAKQSAAYLSKLLKTKVQVKGFSFHFLDKMSLDGVYVEDLNKDTLLYLGHLELKITDWFVFKKEKDLHYLGIKDANIYLNRTTKDSIWNYQFIADAFSNPKDKKDDSNNFPELSLETIKLKNVHFISKDSWIGVDYDINIGNVNLEVDQLSFLNRKLAVKDIFISATEFLYQDYKGGRPDSLKPIKLLDTTPFNPNHWDISVKDLELADARFILHNPDLPHGPKDLFDEWKMDITPIQLKVENINILNDTITGTIKSLMAKERCGIEIKQMQADVKVSPKISECKHLYLETNRSVLTDYYAMHYDRFPDFTEYIEKVKMEGRFENSRVSMDDIAFFAPEMKVFKGIEVILNGLGGGTVDNLYAQNTTIRDGRSELFVGRFGMTELPNIDSSVMTFNNSILQTDGASLIHYFPQLASVENINWLALGNINAPFVLKGRVNAFNVQTLLTSRLGKLDIDGNLNQVLATVPNYNASLGLDNFAIGAFLNTKSLNNANGTIQVIGEGFDGENLILNSKGTLNSLAFENDKLRNIDFKADYKKQVLDIAIKTDDRDARFALEGKVLEFSKHPHLSFDATIHHLNLQKFGITDDEVWAKTILTTDLKKFASNEMTGSAIFNALVLEKDGEILNIDSIHLRSSVHQKIQQLDLSTKHVNAKLYGDYKIMELPNTLQYFLSKYLPNYFKKTNKIVSNQLINFELNIDSSQNVFSFLNPDFQLPKGATATGEMNSTNDLVVLNASAPRFLWDGVLLDSVYVLGSGNKEAFEIVAGTEKAGYGNNTFLNRLSVNATLKDSRLNFLINTATPDEFGSASLSGRGNLLKDSVFIEILPSNIFINNNYWQIPAGNSIVYNNNELSFNNIEINSDDQHIYINKNKQQANNARIELINLGFAPLSRLLEMDDIINGGQINGIINWKNILGKSKLDFDVRSSNVVIQGEPLQSIKAVGNFNQENSLLFLDTLSGITDKEGKLSVSGIWAIGTKKNNTVSGLVNFDNAKIIWLNPILKEYVNQLNGRIDGSVKIYGSTDKLLADGNLTIKQASVRPTVLGERYTIPNADFTLVKNKIKLGNIEVRDMQNQVGQLTGTIEHQNLTRFFFDLHLQSQRFRVLNLIANNDRPYYGKVDAIVNVNMEGWATDLKVQASLSPLENSTLIVPLDFSGDVGTYSFIKFKRPENPSSAWIKKNNSLSSRYKYNIRIDAVINNNLNTNIILDPRTNDELNTRGEGSIVMEIPSDDDIRLNGNYVIESGYYNFTFRQMQVLNFNRKFDIQPGSTISWNGNIYDANLKVSGITTEKARLYDLISDEANRLSLTSSELSDAKVAQIIYVQLKVEGSLKNPEMKFKIEPSESRSLGTYAYQKLERINNDEKALLNQVASLLLLSQFSPPEGFLNNTAAVSSGALNNVTDLVSTVASSQLTNLANRLFNVEDLHVGISYKNYNLANNDNTNPLGTIDYLNRNEAKISVRKNFLKNRLLVDVGTVYDWGRPSQVGNSGTYTTNLAGDFLVQYLIRKDGAVRFNVFRNSNYDALFQQNTARQGIGASYRKSFDNFWDFFGIKKQEHLKDTFKTFPIDTIPMNDSLDFRFLP